MKKIIFLVIAVSIILIIVVINFSEIPSKYECKGTFSRDQKNTETTVYLKLVNYRWWVNLWKKQNHDAVLWVESPNSFYMVYHNIQKAEDVYIIYENNQRQLGRFSILSNNLSFSYHEEIFSGQCTKIN